MPVSLRRKKLILLSAVISTIFFLRFLRIEDDPMALDFSKYPPPLKKTASDPNYAENCIKLYTKLRHPNKSLIVKPPLIRPPQHLLNEFTQNGEMPIKRFWYLNNAYSDSDSENKTDVKESVFDAFNDSLQKVRNNEPLPNYQDKVLNKIMHKHAAYIKDQTMAVIGTEYPWVEAIAFEVGASHITTLDFTRKKYRLPNLEWLHVNDYLDDVIVQQKLEHFDNVASFSSIEHTGLGRYGDPLSPYGDIEAVQQVHCMLKPGGLFFLALPVSEDDSSFILFNAQRVYGSARLNLLFKGWELMKREKDSAGVHEIFVLRKI